MGFVFDTCFVVQYFVSFLVLTSFCSGRESWLLYFNHVLLSYGCKCVMSLSRGAVALSVTCNCAISWSYPLAFSENEILT